MMLNNVGDCKACFEGGCKNVIAGNVRPGRDVAVENSQIFYGSIMFDLGLDTAI